MKRLTIFFSLAAAVFAAAQGAAGQVWNSNAGGWNTGYGTVYGSFGYAMATQNMYNSIQMQIQRLQQRELMIKQFGRAAVERSEREAAAGRRAASPAAVGPAVPPTPVVRNYGIFRPGASAANIKRIADTLGETPEEKKLLAAIVTATKAGFESQTAAKGWKNNIAGAVAFFMTSNATVYNASGETSDEFNDVLFNAIARSIDEIPEFGKMTNAQKQETYDTLVAFAAIPLAVYTEGVNTNDADTVKAAQQLSGKLLEMVLKIDPANMRIENGQIVFGK